LVVAPSARADDRQAACLAASEKAQHLRNAGKLSEARAELVECGRAECPKLIQQDCTQWMSELLAVLPSVVPGAKDKKGRDLVDVRVAIDGKLVAETLDGKPVPVDPGVHTFRFSTKGAPDVEEKVVVRQGEKNRMLTVTFATPGDAAPGSDATTPAEPGRSAPIAAWTVGGLGLVALGAALFIQLDANGDARDLRETCAPRCTQDEVESIDDRFTMAKVMAGVGGALVVTGVVLWIMHASSGPPSRASAALPFISPRPALGGGGAVFRF